MPGRKFSAGGSYRYGFNGKEEDDDVKGDGNQQDYGMRIYDPRLGRFLSVDPLTKSYPWYTPYQFAGNTPIQATDIDGLEEYVVTNYYNRFDQIERTVITYLNDKKLNEVVNLQLITGSGQKISPNHKVLVRNINSKGKLMSYGRKQSLSQRENDILSTGERLPINDPKLDPFGIEFDEGEYLVSEQQSFDDNRYQGFDVFTQFRTTPPPPPYLPGTSIVKFKGANNYTVGLTNITGAGQLGPELIEQLNSIAKQLMHPDSKISKVTITVNQIIGISANRNETTEASRQVNIAIGNMIDVLKSKTKGKNIEFINGGANIIKTEKKPEDVSNSGTTIKFDK